MNILNKSSFVSDFIGDNVLIRERANNYSITKGVLAGISSSTNMELSGANTYSQTYSIASTAIDNALKPM